jgi:hypothetical protein
MFTKVSVLVPTRGRPKQLQTLMDSYARTVTNPRSSELVFRVDSDDHLSLALLQDGPWSVLVGPQMDRYGGVPLVFDDMRVAADGDVLMCGNDHLVFRTPAWPQLVLAETNKYPDGIFHISIGTLDDRISPFGIISRQAVQIVGRLQDPRLHWADAYWRDVMLAFGRDLVLSSVHVEQWTGWTPKRILTIARQSDPHKWDDGYRALRRKVVAEAVNKLRVMHETAACVKATQWEGDGPVLPPVASTRLPTGEC